MDCKTSPAAFFAILCAGMSMGVFLAARTQRWLVIGLAVLLASVAFESQAGTIGLHVGSRHGDPGYNDRNPGLHYRTDDGWTAGAYCNSESRSQRFPDAKPCQISAYAGRTWQTEEWLGLRAGVTVAGVTGYQRAKVLPAAIPSLLIGGHVRLLYLPKIEPKGTQVVSLILETSF